MKTNNNISNNNEGCMTSDMLLKYIKGELSGFEKNRVERHLSSCEMCSDELEGLLLLQNPDDISKIENRLNARIDEVVDDEKKIASWGTYFKIAASVTLLLGISSLIYFLGFRNPNSNVISDNVILEKSKPLSVEDTNRALDIKQAESIKKMENQEFATTEASIVVNKPARSSMKSIEAEVKYVAPVVVDSVSVMVADEAVLEEVKMDVADSVSPLVSEIVAENQVAAAYAPAKAEEVDRKELASKKSKLDTGNAITIRGVSSMSTSTPKKELAIKLYTVGDYQNALYLLKKLEKKYPESDTIHYYTAMCYYKLNQYDSSLKAFEILTNNPNSSFYDESQWYYALSLTKIDNKQKAIDVLNKIILEESTYKDSARRELERLNGN